MPSDCTFIGNAPAIKQVDTLTLGGTIEVGDRFEVTINGKLFRYTAASAVAADEATALAAAWNALPAADYPEFAEITAAATSGGALTLTAKKAGKPFTATVATFESNGGAADAQTFGTTNTVACSGPNFWSLAANWSNGAVPITGDSVFLDGAVCNAHILYGLDQNAVTLAGLYARNQWKGDLGLPERNKDSSAAEYDEYRDTELKIGITAVDVTCASGRIKINSQAVQTAITVRATGSAKEAALAAFQWRGTHASNTLTVEGGNVGVALTSGHAATLASFTQTEGTLRIGADVTLGDMSKTGGNLTLDDATVALVSMRCVLTGDSKLIATA